MNKPVKYQISDMTDEDVMEINSTARLWSTTDAIRFYSYKGNENYLNYSNFIDFCEEKGYSEQMAQKVCNFFSRDIKTGDIKLSKRKLEEYKTIIIDLAYIEREGRLKKCLLQYRRVIVDLLKKGKIKKEKMAKKLDKYNAKIEYVTRQKEALQVLEYIYNYSESNKVAFTK